MPALKYVYINVCMHAGACIHTCIHTHIYELFRWACMFFISKKSVLPFFLYVPRLSHAQLLFALTYISNQLLFALTYISNIARKVHFQQCSHSSLSANLVFICLGFKMPEEQRGG